MSKRSAKWLAWSLWVLGMALTVLTGILDTLNGHRVSAPLLGELTGSIALTVGALIVSRDPSNRIGWLFVLCRLLLAFGGTGDLADQYGMYTFVTRPGALPAGTWVEWLGLVTQITGFVPLVTFLPLLFPDGRPPSPRWQPLVWATWLLLGLFIIGGAFQPALDTPSINIPNPFGLAGMEILSGPVVVVSAVLSTGLVFLCVVSVLLRFRRASGDERQQLKWFGFAALLIPLSFLIGSSAILLNIPAVLNLPLWQASVAGIPIAVGIAIFKYRLYDIDLIIRRTLIYGVLTVMLGAVYFGLVVVLQEIFRQLTGQGSDVAIVLSTLAIAALFMPLRSRIQQAIDRRFYRRKYDAQKILARFGATVRDEVDLSSLTDDLLAVIDETMQPAQASLWLRTTADNGRRTASIGERAGGQR